MLRSPVHRLQPQPQLCHSLTFSFSLLPADVLSEEAILKWYTEAHVAKGKSVFLEQMKKFVEWLKNAEEGNVVFRNSAHF